jgi:predicted metal-binding membrane protein
MRSTATNSSITAMTSTSQTGRSAALAATLGVAGVCWVIAARQMRGMDMGASTELGSFAFFVGAWVPMMAAMMLPSAAPAVSRFLRDTGRTLATPLFAGWYLAVWTLVGVAVYLVYRPHSTAVAGALTIAAGAYELTPLKRHCRERCRESVRSGLQYGLNCVGSSIGLMVILVALGVMSLTWMVVIAALVLTQKFVAPHFSVDVPVALAIVSLGLLVAFAPGSVPGLVVPM